MCGIVGVYSVSKGLQPGLLENMAAAMAYRGPDSSGVWIAPDGPLQNRLGFGHRRLSILDLSPAGHQPMHSSSGRYTITFNGEVFNYRELASTLSGPINGGSDTAVMLAAFEELGIEEAVKRFVGMFAFAVWDNQLSELTLVRDRLGIKPLYYGWCGASFVFTSDLAAYRAHPDFSINVDHDGANLFFRYGYVPAPYSIEKGVNKLLPGSRLTLKLPVTSQETELVPERYWDLAKISHCKSEYLVSESSLDDLEELLTEAVKLRMIADVPLGAFLSGGIDSSLITALMQKVASGPVKTFSIGFAGTAQGDSQYDESPFARAVSQHLGTDHTEMQVTAQMALDVIPHLSEIADEPFGDVSIIPTYLVCKLARKQVTVALSGDGGDELFGGYNRYILLDKMANLRRRIPAPLRHVLASTETVVSLGSIDYLQRGLQKLGLFPFQLDNPGEKVRKMIKLLNAPSSFDLYKKGIRHWSESDAIVRNVDQSLDLAYPDQLTDFRLTMALADKLYYLPDDILTKVDRASMACSLEARVPFLDHRVVEFASRLPSGFLYRDGRGKWPLREILKRHLPVSLIDRPKRGFSVPIDSWLRGELRDWAANLLSSSELEKSGILNTRLIENSWSEHLSGRRNIGQLLWNVLMFQTWYLKSR